MLKILQASKNSSIIKKIFKRGDFMEMATIFLIWLAVVVIDNLAKRKKRRLPPPQNNSPDFDIPTLTNDPNFPGEEIPIFIESPRPAEIRQKNFTPRPKKNSERVQEFREPEETNELDLNFAPSNVMDAIILSEILGKPKSLRKKNI